MRFTFTLEQREFFRKNRYIEFEGLLSASQAALLDKKAEELLARRLNLPPAKEGLALANWDKVSSLNLYKAGYDLWREEESIKKATQKLSIACIAAELFDTTPLRVAFDQFCVVNNTQTPPFSTALSLAQISSVKPLAGAVLFLLEDLLQEDLLQESPGFKGQHNLCSFPLPKKAGNALFFAPDFPLPWDKLYSLRNLRFLLTAFAPVKSYYRQEPSDPHSPVFKKWGYVYNDQLKEELHPILYGKK